MIPTIFTPDAIPAATLSIYPSLAQARWKNKKKKRLKRDKNVHQIPKSVDAV